MIKLKWLGHSCFRAEYEGQAVVLDPFAPGSVPGFRDIDETAGMVLCSHQHHDHNYTDGVRLSWDASHFKVTALETFHDGCGGEQRGANLVHILKAGGVSIAHMGDIGCMPGPEAIEQLKGVTAMLIPVGGFYTVGPEEAMEIVRAVNPRVVIPMHYRSSSFGFDVLGTVEEFLGLCGNVTRLGSDSAEITGDMAPETLVFEYK